MYIYRYECFKGPNFYEGMRVKCVKSYSKGLYREGKIYTLRYGPYYMDNGKRHITDFRLDEGPTTGYDAEWLILDQLGSIPIEDIL